MPTMNYTHLGAIPMGLNEATHRTHTDGDDHDIWAAPYVAPCAGRITAMRYQVTTTIANATVAAIIRLAVADADGSSNQAEVTDTPTTLAAGLAAANAWAEVLVNGGQGYAVASGQTIFANVKTAGTGTPAGSVRIIAIFVPSAL